jgi:DNA-binding transcriptional MerR regulator
VKLQDLDDNRLTVTDFSELVGIPANILRRYDREGILCPSVTIPQGKQKQRYYSLEQTSTAKMLRVLWVIGVQPKTIRTYVKTRSPQSLIKLLNKTKLAIENEMHLLQKAYSIIGMFVDTLQEGGRITETELSVSTIPEKRIILGQPNKYQAIDGYFKEYRRFCTEPHNPPIDLSYKIGGYFDNMDEFIKNPSLPTRFYSLDPHGKDSIEQRLYLIGYTRGCYGQTNDLPEKMKAFADKHGLIFDGPVYNIYLYDELSIGDSSQYLLQVTAAITDMSLMPNRRPKLHDLW